MAARTMAWCKTGKSASADVAPPSPKEAKSMACTAVVGVLRVMGGMAATKEVPIIAKAIAKTKNSEIICAMALEMRTRTTPAAEA